jgi:hypothetical protein
LSSALFACLDNIWQSRISYSEIFRLPQGSPDSLFITLFNCK